MNEQKDFTLCNENVGRKEKEMKKILVTLLVALCACTLFAQGANESASQSVSTDGSTSMESVVLSLAEVFEENTGIVVTYNPTGSGSGITAAQEGRADIGLSSRALKDSEVASGLTGTEDVCKYSQELTSTGAVITAVVSNPNAIGYASLSAVNDTVKTVLVNGVAPSEETVLSGDYQIQRPFVFVTKSDSALSESAQQFFDFALSTDASDIIADAGAVPLV